ncbi:hypothetical protein BX600DRAFT_438385 [Xylariales sp. PMI_506]|nr:hypothetical protein BX600DRAFT_438385 [Xylariales sp. PMI_506]
MSAPTYTFSTRVQSAWAAVKQHAKEHHESVTAAYEYTYGPSYTTRAAAKGKATSVSAAPSPAASINSTPASSTPASPRMSLDKAWNNVKKHAKEHHHSVVAAYDALYNVRA